jgi:aarF domain-containing kinase
MAVTHLSSLLRDSLTSSTNVFHHETSNDKSNNCRILASSPTYFLDERNILRRFLRYLSNLLQTLWDVTLIAWRSAEVVLLISPLSILTPTAILVSKALDEEANNPASELAWWYTFKALSALGPVFVKLAQWVATRQDVFPPNICNRLSRLHDHASPHSWAHSHQLLKEDLGPDYAERGLEIHELIGCGSAAQVYRGTLRMTDKEGMSIKKEVAVKVLHPRLNLLLERDLSLMESMAKLLNAIPLEAIRMVNLPRVADNFGYILRRQADLRIEGENLKQFRANFEHERDDSRSSAIWFPRPMDGWIGCNVLVEDLVQGCSPISEYLRDTSQEGLQARRELAGPLLRAFLKMVFLDNFVHADIHPGNVLVRTTIVPRSRFNFFTRAEHQSGSDSNKVKVKRTIVFIDAGIATSLSPNDQKNLRDLFRAVILNDGNSAGRLMVERAKYERCSQVEGGVDAFAKGVEEIVSEFHDRRKQGLTLGAVRIGSLLSRVLDLCRTHGVEIDPSMASIVISTLVLEGLGRSLEPNLNLIDFALPFVLGRGKV